MGLVLGIVSFALCFMLHILLWRLSVPQKPYRALVLVWIFALFVVVLAVWLALGRPPTAVVIYGAVVGSALITSYLFFYVGIKHDSPSLSVISELAKRGSRGFPASDVELFARTHPFVRARLDQLICDGLVTLDASGFLHAAGSAGLMMRLSAIYRGWTCRTGVRG